MASLTLTIPDAAVPRIGAAFKSAYAYDPASGLSDAAFVKQCLSGYIKQVVKEQEGLAILESGKQETSAEATANDAQVEAIPIA